MFVVTIGLVETICCRKQLDRRVPGRVPLVPLQLGPRPPDTHVGRPASARLLQLFRASRRRPRSSAAAQRRRQPASRGVLRPYREARGQRTDVPAPVWSPLRRRVAPVRDHTRRGGGAEAVRDGQTARPPGEPTRH